MALAFGLRGANPWIRSYDYVSLLALLNNFKVSEMELYRRIDHIAREFYGSFFNRNCKRMNHASDFLQKIPAFDLDLEPLLEVEILPN